MCTFECVECARELLVVEVARGQEVLVGLQRCDDGAC